MKSYIGTKVIQAELMDEGDFSTIVKKGEGKAVLGDNGKFREGYKVVYEDGYISWSPKEVFERCYREITESEKALVPK